MSRGAENTSGAADGNSTIAAERLRLVPVTQADGTRVGELLQPAEVRRYFYDGSGLPRDVVATMIGESLSASSSSIYWRIAARETDFGGIIGLRPPSQASLALRAIGWRSLEMVIALDPRCWGRGLAGEAVEAVARYASQDGVTFALVGCVDEADERAHRLMRRCRFEFLGRAAGPRHQIAVYERPL